MGLDNEYKYIKVMSVGEFFPVCGIKMKLMVIKLKVKKT